MNAIPVLTVKVEGTELTQSLNYSHLIFTYLLTYSFVRLRGADRGLE